MHTRSFLVLLFVVALVAKPALAGKEKSRTSEEKAAKKACATGDFQKGVDILADLFVDTNDLTYVYNQGRCYQQNNRWEQAISRFREYLRKAKDLSVEERSEAEQQIRDCEDSLPNTAPSPSPPAVLPSNPSVDTSQPIPPSPEVTKSEVASSSSPTPMAGSQGKRLRTAGIVFGVAGLAALGTGVGLALKTQSISSDEQKNGATKAKEDQRKLLETWGWVSYGVGAAAIATGVVLYVMGWPSDQTTSVALLPVATPDGPAVTLKGAF